MEYRKLGKSDLEVSVITLGAWQYGCERYWGKVPEKDIYEVIARSVDSGINIIDTAIGYDDSEIIVGNAVKKIRDRLIIASKGGADPDKIPQRVDLSLKRMGLVLYCYWQVLSWDSVNTSIPVFGLYSPFWVFGSSSLPLKNGLKSERSSQVWSHCHSA